MARRMPGRLFLVATPIGNLGDISQRAIEVLAQVNCIACEDTRHSRPMLDGFGISTPTVSLPAFYEGARCGPLLERLDAGEDLALITDAGSPAVSDPGERLVSEAIARGVEVVPVPGASALVAALSASGLPTGRFHFFGFLPRTSAVARDMLDEVSALAATLVFYESPRRLQSLLALLLEVLGDRRACVARELTKVHEEFARGTLSALAALYQSAEVLGEVVVLVEGRRAETRWSEADLSTALRSGLAAGEKLKGLSTELARRAGWSSQVVYRLGLGLKIKR
jgi:16S rRNA (cytidine1402-2'-O)-methyltransferase